MATFFLLLLVVRSAECEQASVEFVASARDTSFFEVARFELFSQTQTIGSKEMKIDGYGASGANKTKSQVATPTQTHAHTQTKVAIDSTVRFCCVVFVARN